VIGECTPSQDALEFTWLSVEDATSPLVAAEMSGGQDRLLRLAIKLRNAVTGLMKSEGYGEGYQYPPDFEGSVVPGESYLPEALEGSRFYEPTQQGLEQAIGERLARLRGKAT
jgi:putative ATPase